MRVLKWLAILLVLAVAGAGLYYVMRPTPPRGSATLPKWVAAFDAARVDAPPVPVLPFRVGADRYATLWDAKMHAPDNATISIAPGTYTNDCAVVTDGMNLTFRAEIEGSVTFKGGKLCEGKAVLVLRGGAVTVEGLRFVGFKTYDANAAGIRAEAGHLIVRNSAFEDSENSVLGNVNHEGSVTIEHSIFRRLGGCPPEKLCAHSLYLGETGRVAIRDSLFERGVGGHYLKLRGPNIDVENNLIDDSKGHGTSYLIDLPNGANGKIMGNTLVKGRDADNRCCGIIIGEEGLKNPSGVVIRGNTAINLDDRPVIFLADMSGQAKSAANDMRGWWIERSGLVVRGRCFGCKALAWLGRK